MKDTLFIGTPPIEVRIRRSARARKYALRISNADGAVSLTVPNHASLQEGVHFAKRHALWLQNALAKKPPPQPLRFGGTLLFEGVELRLEHMASGSVRRLQDRLLVPGTEASLAAKLRGYCKVQARERLLASSDKYARALGVTFNRISLRDTRSRWGSCTEAGNLMYSWRLILAPPKVLDYVAAHEVAHLSQMNHSAAYWQLVADICPEYAQHRAWLKTKGALLHRVLF